MATRPRSRTPYQDNWRDQLTDVVSAAVSPLAKEIKELSDIVGNIRLTAVSRTDVYDRGIMDEKLKKLDEDISAVRASIDKFQADIYKALGGAAAVITVVVLLFQHVSIR